MLLLSLIWFVLGLFMGCTSLVTHFQPVGWIKKYHKRAVILLGGSAGCLGGWLGVWFFGHLFASVTAIWFAGVIVLIVPWSLACFLA